MLYKYRSLDNFRYFVDILLNQRLYAASYPELNDPMEGHWLGAQLPDPVRAAVAQKKAKVRICSLSRTPVDPVMWAHYADGGKGVTIGLEISDKHAEACNVQYTIPESIVADGQKSAKELARRVLSYKAPVWKYEEEVRVFTERQFVNVNVREVIVGRHEDLPFMARLVKRVCEGGVSVVPFRTVAVKLDKPMGATLEIQMPAGRGWR